MKTFRTAGTATEWSPSGVPQTVTRLESVSPVGNSYKLPVQLSLKGETTRKGVRRVVLSAGCAIPGTVLNDMYTGINVDAKGSTPVSVHIVFQGPQLACMAEAGASTGSGILDLVLGRLTTDLIAVVSNETISPNADNHSLTGLISRAMCGSTELDVVSGSYGTASA